MEQQDPKPPPKKIDLPLETIGGSPLKFRTTLRGEERELRLVANVARIVDLGTNNDEGEPNFDVQIRWNLVLVPKADP